MLLLVLAIVVALIARRLRFPYTLALVLVGLLLGFVHVDPQLHLEPDLVLLLFLPALLFEGAWNVDMRALRANLPFSCSSCAVDLTTSIPVIVSASPAFITPN